jgi:hypothetical protein
MIMGIRRRIVPLILAAVLALAPIPSLSQYRPDEVARRDAWEKFLATAEIVKSERLGEGVTIPWKLTLRSGDVEKKAVWKGTTGLQEWRYEIAAYRLDKLLGLAMLPPSVERDFNGKRGALVLWADSKTSLLKLVEDNEKARQAGRPEDPPRPFEETVGRGKYATRIWDCLVANEDRTQENVLYTDDWRTLLIDHSYAFRSEGEYADKLVYGKNGIKKYAGGDLILIKQAPRALMERIKALDAESIKAAAGNYLTDSEIAAVLKRKVILISEVEEMAKMIGEGKFYF